MYQIQMPRGVSPDFNLIVHSRVLRWATGILYLWFIVATITSFARRFHDMGGSALWAYGTFTLMFHLSAASLEDGFGAGVIAYVVTFLFALVAGTSPSTKYGPIGASNERAIVPYSLPGAPPEDLVWQSIFIKVFVVGVAVLCLAEFTVGVLLS